MILEIRKVNKCTDDDYGNFRIAGKEKAIINISLSKNPLVAEYGATLLHELLHFWVTMLRKEGVKVRNSTEHKFIYAVEEKVILEMKNHFKKGTK